jgi:hypothetical protein
MAGDSGGLRGGELKGGIVQQFAELIAVHLKVPQFQTSLNSLDPLTSEKVGSFVKRLLSLAQIGAQSFTVMALVASIDLGSCKFACKLFNAVLLPLIQTARISELCDETGELICGDIGVVLGLIRIVGGWTGIIRHVCRTRRTTHRGGHQLPPRDTPATRANECILEVVLRC